MSTIKYWVWLSALRLRPRAKQLMLDHFAQDPMETHRPPKAVFLDGKQVR